MSSPTPDYAGMTINERLFEAGSFNEFDAAIESGDRRRAIEVLVRVAMTEDGAAETVDAVLLNPSKYGYPRPA